MCNAVALQEELILELSLQKFDIEAEEIIVQLVATNTGSHPLIISYLREGLFEQYGDLWCGWVLWVNKCNIHETFKHSFRRYPELQKEDLVTLNPGNALTLSTNLAPMLTFNPEYHENAKISHPVLINLDGEYQAFVAFGFPEHAIPQGLKHLVWKGESQSNTLRFLVTREKRRMFFPGDQVQLLSPDGQYAVIDGEHENETNEFSPGGTLSLRNMTTKEDESLYSYTEHVEVLWSPEGSRILINDYACRNSDSYHPAFPLIFFMETRELVDVREELRQALGEKLIQKAYIMGTKWLHEDRLLLRVFNYGMKLKEPQDIHKVRQRYEYDLIQRNFRRLE